MFPVMRSTREICLAALLAAAPPGVARAETTTATRPASGLTLGARTFARDSGGGVELDLRHRFHFGFELGAELHGSYLEKGYLSGQPVTPVLAAGGGLVLLLPALSSDRIDLFFRYVPGVARLDGVDRDATALRQTNEIGAFGHVLLGHNSLIRTGVLLGVDLEVDPTVDLADQSQLLTLGYGHALSEHLLCYADVTAGGTFGFNGDNGKAIVEASLGFRIPLAKGGARGAF